MSDLAAGLVFGLAAGLLPGPLLTLVIQRTLEHGAREGMRVAVAPLLSDLPIATVAVALLSRAGESETVLGLVSVGGAIFLGWLAVGSLAAAPRRTGETADPAPPRSVRDGVVANLLNPHPYLFWATVGGPIVSRTWATSPVVTMGFLVAMYGALVGSKVAVAALVGRGRSVLGTGLYRTLLRGLGVVLLVFALQFLWQGLGRLFG